jgi:hypothetical protein
MYKLNNRVTSKMFVPLTGNAAQFTARKWHGCILRNFLIILLNSFILPNTYICLRSNSLSMNLQKRIAFIVMMMLVSSGFAQRVSYSEPDKDDSRQTAFEIIGRMEGNVLIYKNLRDNHSISLYDADMKQKERVKLSFLPERVINADFLAYPDFAYMFYQYQRKSVVYCMAAKLNPVGKIVGEPVTLDTTHISFFASNKLYNVINSEDKQIIAVYKINSKNERNYLVTPVLFNKDLQLLEKKYLNIVMPERNDFLTEFAVDNDGNVVFSKAARNQSNDNIQSASILVKKRDANELIEYGLPLKNQYLDEVRIKVDNYNKTYIISSFYSKKRYGNIEGLYNCVWDATANTIKANNSVEFSDQLRADAKGDNGIKTAFNDYFLRNMIVRRDGGFLVAAESFFTTGRGGGYNRSDYLYNSPFIRPMDYYFFSPYSYSYPWSRWNSFNQITRYHAQNIAVFSFDASGKLNWNKVINKTQYDDETDAFIGYQLVNTGDQLHFLFNQQEKRLLLLSDQSIAPNGQVTRAPTLKNLDKGYDFMPRYGKQIGSRQIIFPCMYRNYLCFARLEL